MSNGSMGPPGEIDPTTRHTMNGCSTMELHLAPVSVKKLILPEIY